MVREYLYAEQLAEVTPWTTDAIEKMVRRGTLKRGVHWFQPLGRGTKKLFKWTAIVSLIEGAPVAEPSTAKPATAILAEGFDVNGAETALRRLLDRTCA